ncbi:MAG: endonuclease III [Parachlamydiaceae bacterium]|nr:endonuclease III [Parachlamydiaceae bacterium]
MTKKEISKKIQNILIKLYPNPKIPLTHTDNFTLLIAVMLSARCTDVRVNKITPLLFAEADTPQKMVKLPVPEIEEIIRPCGLSPQKAKAILGTAEAIINKYHGKVPNTFEELESLPGVGHKTASVVMWQAFQKNAFPVDTHIHRLAKRWGLSEAKNVKETEKDLKELFPKKDWGIMAMRIIFFGREYCPALRHNKDDCPICSWL